MNTTDEIVVGDVVYAEGASAILGDVVEVTESAVVVTWRATTTHESPEDLVLSPAHKKRGIMPGTKLDVRKQIVQEIAERFESSEPTKTMDGWAIQIEVYDGKKTQKLWVSVTA